MAIRSPMAASVAMLLATAPSFADSQVERGGYLVTAIGGCGDCHTSGSFFGHPDIGHALGGSDVGFAVPGLGTFVAPNLTPDKETGLGAWTPEEIATAITTGVRPDGRILAPPMPWRSFSHLTRQDVLAIAAYLKSLPPVFHKVPGPFGPNEKPTVFLMMPIAPDVFAGLPKPLAESSGAK